MNYVVLEILANTLEDVISRWTSNGTYRLHTVVVLRQEDVNHFAKLQVVFETK